MENGNKEFPMEKESNTFQMEIVMKDHSVTE